MAMDKGYRISAARGYVHAGHAPSQLLRGWAWPWTRGIGFPLRGVMSTLDTHPPNSSEGGHGHGQGVSDFRCEGLCPRWTRTLRGTPPRVGMAMDKGYRISAARGYVHAGHAPSQLLRRVGMAMDKGYRISAARGYVHAWTWAPSQLLRGWAWPWTRGIGFPLRGVMSTLDTHPPNSSGGGHGHGQGVSDFRCEGLCPHYLSLTSTPGYLSAIAAALLNTPFFMFVFIKLVRPFIALASAFSPPAARFNAHRAALNTSM